MAILIMMIKRKEVLSHNEWISYKFPLPLWERDRVRGN